MARKKKEAPEAVTSSESPVISPAFVRKPEAVKASAPVSGDTVVVALNRPYGLSFRMPNGKKVTIKGNGESLIGKEKGILPIGAYGLTTIAADDWDYIMKNFSTMPIFKNGLCFATKRKADAVDEAENRDDLRNGLEPVDPEKTATKEAEKGE